MNSPFAKNLKKNRYLIIIEGGRREGGREGGTRVVSFWWGGLKGWSSSDSSLHYVYSSYTVDTILAPNLHGCLTPP